MRVVLAQPRGFCAGVVRAIDIVERALEKYGRPVYVLPLDKDRIVSVEGPRGRTIVEIRNHRVRIADSACPNKLCIKQGWIDSGGLVCLPNKVVVTIGGHEGKNTAVDAITG